MSVVAKGPTPSFVEWLIGKLEDAGYNGVDITMKSDQEKAIKSLNKFAVVSVPNLSIALISAYS